ncbi:hypothetical protein [Sphingomonas sp.]|uniref:hypothetical protein n=1 Tax=Sphingomonas sp. TaxID=28214 RepID=UPI0031D98DAF
MTMTYLKLFASSGALACFAAAISTPAASQTAQPSQDAVDRQIARVGADAQTVGELQTGIASACAIQPWQLILRSTGPRGIRIEASPTLSRLKLRCAFAVVDNSRFYVANPKRERP